MSNSGYSTKDEYNEDYDSLPPEIAEKHYNYITLQKIKQDRELELKQRREQMIMNDNNKRVDNLLEKIKYITTIDLLTTSTLIDDIPPRTNYEIKNTFCFTRKVSKDKSNYMLNDIYNDKIFNYITSLKKTHPKIRFKIETGFKFGTDHECRKDNNTRYCDYEICSCFNYKYQYFFRIISSSINENEIVYKFGQNADNSITKKRSFDSDVYVRKKDKFFN